MNQPGLSHFAIGRRFRLLLAFSLLASAPALAANGPVLDSLSVSPAIVNEGNKKYTNLTTEVTLKTPAPAFFICELRSSERRRVECSSIIFKKGETTATGSATVFWDNVPMNTKIKLSAFSVDNPIASVSFTVTLKKAADTTY